MSQLALFVERHPTAPGYVLDWGDVWTCEECGCCAQPDGRFPHVDGHTVAGWLVVDQETGEAAPCRFAS